MTREERKRRRHFDSLSPRNQGLVALFSIPGPEMKWYAENKQNGFVKRNVPSLWARATLMFAGVAAWAYLWIWIFAEVGYMAGVAIIAGIVALSAFFRLWSLNRK